ncbi:PREDICTED: probable ATP-dependent RNA helicase ddx42 [Nicotiana attenuata]|uniref:probable ATP-dependent RNA helicase ddx42 n=1 Tax=Nicotiana attenuata TaxID=49451 RepID=UPI0009055FD0|nr:PREDICTED: probable ATP-dependent RNA helicase ddx42 [Nicotiana attenuata]
MSFEKLYDKLLAHEVFLQHSEPKTNTPLITAQLNQRAPSNQNSFRRNYNNAASNTQQRRSNQQQGGPNNSFNSRHHPGPPNNNSRSFGSRQSNQQRVQCQLCDKCGHIAKVCRSQSHNKYEAQANMVARSYNNNGNPWVMDSGASHHITDNPSNLTFVTDFSGNDEIIIGDGFEHGGSTTSRTEQQ